jgi:hypothetical protein
MKSLKIPEAVNQRRKKDRQYSGQKKKEEGQTIQRPKEEEQKENQQSANHYTIEQHESH